MTAPETTTATRDRLPAYSVDYTIAEIATTRAALRYYAAAMEAGAQASEAQGSPTLARIERAEANYAKAALAATERSD